MPVRITVKAEKCQGKIHEIGQAFTVDKTTPEGVCTGAWDAIAPYVMTLLCGGNFSREEKKGIATLHCPDPKGITLELRSIGK